MTDVYEDLVHDLKKNTEAKASVEQAIHEIAKQFAQLSRTGPNQPADGYELASLVRATDDSAKDIAAACFVGTPVMVPLDQAEEAVKQHKARMAEIEKERAKKQADADAKAARDKELTTQDKAKAGDEKKEKQPVA